MLENTQLDFVYFVFFAETSSFLHVGIRKSQFEPFFHCDYLLIDSNYTRLSESEIRRSKLSVLHLVRMVLSPIQ